jgi:hypothetical protein
VSEVARSVTCLATDGRPGDRGSIPGRGERIFPLASVSRPALGPTQPPVQWVPGVLSPGLKRGRGVTLTTPPHPVPRSRMSRSYTSSPSSAFVACSGTALAFRINLDEWWARRKGFYLHRSTQKRKMRTNIFALSGIRVNNLGVQAIKTYVSHREALRPAKIWPHWLKMFRYEVIILILQCDTLFKKARGPPKIYSRVTGPEPLLCTVTHISALWDPPTCYSRVYTGRGPRTYLKAFFA